LIIVTAALLTSAAKYGNPMRGHAASSPSLQARGLNRVTLLVPVGCADGLRLLARELRARQRLSTADVSGGWRRLSPSAELFVDRQNGARCAVRDTGALGAELYYWTVSAFGEYQVAEGRTEELTEARSQAEAALAAYKHSGDDGGNL
jgi:hypothetical protein